MLDHFPEEHGESEPAVMVCAARQAGKTGTGRALAEGQNQLRCMDFDNASCPIPISFLLGYRSKSERSTLEYAISMLSKRILT
jgi:hypothetical protein